MEKLIKEIMEEIFTIDPDLKKYQKELEATMVKMIKNKPDTNFDDNFKEELKTKLLARAEELERGKTKGRAPLFRNIRFWQSVSLAAVIAALVLILVLPAYYGGESIVPGLNLQIKKSPLALLTGEMQINRTGDRAFGDLKASSEELAVSDQAAQESVSQTGFVSGTAAQPSAPSQLSNSAFSQIQPPSGLGGGGQTLPSTLGTAQTGVIAPAGAAPDIAPRPWPPELVTVYKYVYSGEEFDLPEPTVEVLKRVKGFGRQDFSSTLRSLSLGLIDVSKFTDVKVQHLSVVEDKKGGYMIDINPYEGLISVTENYFMVNPVMYENLPRLRAEDVPGDEKLIDVANRFLAQYGVNLSQYGTPEVNHDWRDAYRETELPADIWIPDTINVLYPFLLEGKEIFEQGGYSKVGFSVGINIRTMKVAGVYGLMTLNFDASSYTAETDKDRIMKFVEQGDIWPQPNYPAEDFQVTEVTVTLGTPKLGYMRYWRYSGLENDELYIPALIFPVEGVGGGGPFWKRAVVIPLVKEILDSVSQESVAPMPLVEPAPAIKIEEKLQPIKTEEVPQ